MKDVTTHNVLENIEMMHYLSTINLQKVLKLVMFNLDCQQTHTENLC